MARHVLKLINLSARLGLFPNAKTARVISFESSHWRLKNFLNKQKFGNSHLLEIILTEYYCAYPLCRARKSATVHSDVVGPTVRGVRIHGES